MMNESHDHHHQQPEVRAKQTASTKRLALVTGSSTGIGANIAIDLAKAGYRVIVTGRSIDKLAQVVQQCNEVSSSKSSSANDKSAHENDVDGDEAAVSFVADLFDFKQVDMLVDFVKTKFNRLDVLVNNACWRGDDSKNILQMNAYEDLKKVMHINLSIPMYLVDKFFVEKDGVRDSCFGEVPIIVNVTSIASQLVVPLHLYSISKACLFELSRQLALASSKLGLLSIAVSPGPVLTEERPHHKYMSPLTLMNRVGCTQEISNPVIFAIEHPHLFNGREIVVDGGYISKQK